jgi:tetratricopeptide (TPR) repeat protein
LETKQTKKLLQFLDALYFFWFRRGYWREGERWLVEAVAQIGNKDSASLCFALLRLGIFISLQGRYSEAATYLERVLPMARRLEEPEPLAAVLVGLAQATPDNEQALATMDEAIIIMQENEQLKPDLAALLDQYGNRLRDSGQHRTAATYYQQSLDLMRQMGNVDMIAYPLGNLGRLALQAGHLQEAYDFISESVALSRDVRNWVGIGDWVFRLGLVLLYKGEINEAQTNLQEALTYYQEMGNLRGQQDVLACLAQVALVRGDLETAVSTIQESLSIYQAFYLQLQASQAKVDKLFPIRLTSISPDLVDSFLRAALVATAQEAYERATTFFSIAEKLQFQVGHVPVPPLQASVDKAFAIVRTQLVPAELFDSAWKAGQTMSLNQVLAFALAS